MKQLNNGIFSVPIENLPSTSTITKRRLKFVGVNTFYDLLNYFPFRYEDYSLVTSINKVQNGEIVTLKGTIIKFKNVFTRTGLKIQKATIADQSGKIEAVWFNQPYLYRVLHEGQFISLAGAVKGFFKDISIEAKEYEILTDLKSSTVHTGRLIPIYPEKNGLSSRLLREKIFFLLNQFDDGRHQDGISEFFPKEIISYNNLVSEVEAYKEIHFPTNKNTAKKARQRLAFDELFTVQLSARLTKLQWQKERVINPFKVETLHEASLQSFIKNLPFKLTSAQKRVINEIISDLKKSVPMNRFLEGDVGSGKTVVAAIASYLAYLNGYQSLIMAPTEILVQQHFQTITKIMSLFNINVCLITGGKKYKVSRIKNKENKILNTKYPILDTDILIGTHALLNQKIKFENVGLVIIDEQHRFGVAQRAMLKEKGLSPHLLTMTATPIPRTVALTLYGELDLSVIDEMPIGRLPVKTFLVPKEKRDSGYNWIKEQIKKFTIQVFIICPLIEESEIETMKSVKAVTKEYERLKKDIFPELKLKLLHGKIKSKEKEIIMNDFKNKKFDILVSTPVVEVGIDVPNATVMLIEGAERFGLAQLHQLRGRVGRGYKQSYCFLYTESKEDKVTERLNFFVKTQSGMEVAEYDLKMRGPGEIFGTRQHGYLDLKVASLSDFELITKSKKAVDYFIKNYSVDKFKEIKKRLEEYRFKQISRD